MLHEQELAEAELVDAHLQSLLAETEGWDDADAFVNAYATPIGLSIAPKPKRRSIFNKKPLALSVATFEAAKHPRGNTKPDSKGVVNRGEFGQGGGQGAKAGQPQPLHQQPQGAVGGQPRPAPQQGKGAAGFDPHPKVDAEGQAMQARVDQAMQAQQDYQQNGTRAKAFKSWFGDWEAAKKTGSSLWGKVSAVIDRITGAPKQTYPVQPSKVTDQEGKPITVYHGTSTRFDEFDPKHANDNAQYGPGFYFSESADFASSFVGGSGLTGGNKGKDPNVIKAYLNIKKPFDANAHLSRLATAPGMAKFPYEFIADAVGGNAKAQAKLKALGYDGITHTDTHEGKQHRVWIAFEANQVKSVDNQGTFSPASNKMTLSAATHDVTQEKRDEGGKWSEGGAVKPKRHAPESSTTIAEDATAQGKLAVAQVQGNLAAAYREVHDLGSAVFHSMPKIVQRCIATAVAAAFAAWSASQELAERVSRQKGATPEQAAQTRQTLAAVDLAGFKPLVVAAHALGPVATAATWVIPPATGAYLLANTLAHPICTYKAAKEMIEDVAGGIKYAPAVAEQAVQGITDAVKEDVNNVAKDTRKTVGLSAADDGTAKYAPLLEALEAHQWDDWYATLLHAAIVKTKDIGKAIQVADAAFKQQPEDVSQPEPDDADRLFGAAGPVKPTKLSAADDNAFIALPDIRQDDDFSCDAMVCCAIGKLWGVGPKEKSAWKKELGTTRKDSTDPERIIEYFGALGCPVEARDQLTLDDLRAYWQKGWPVLCLIQEYGVETKQQPYGHAVGVVGVAHGYVFVQDPSIENVESGKIDAAPGKMMIDEETWLKVWWDKRDGKRLERYGIAVGPPKAGAQLSAAWQESEHQRGSTKADARGVINPGEFGKGGNKPGAKAGQPPASQPAPQGGAKAGQPRPAAQQGKGAASFAPHPPAHDAAGQAMHEKVAGAMQAMQKPLPDLRPAHGDLRKARYLDVAMANLKRTSRTATGTVDTSASAGKAGQMAQGLTGDQAAQHATENFANVMGGLYDQRMQDYSDPNRVKELCDNVNRQLNKGITKADVLLRTADSDKFPYTAVADIPLARQQFAQEFAQRLSDPKADPIATAAWVEWRVNRDHVYADGCGKTQRALAAIPLMRANLPLPNYDDPKKFFKFMPKTPPDPKQGPESYTNTEEYKKFENYYRMKCPAHGTRAVREIEKHFPIANPTGVDALERHSTGIGKDGMHTYGPERTALHEKIDQKLRGHVPASKDKVYMMMGGGPASGKSSIIMMGMVRKMNGEPIVLPDKHGHTPSHVHIDSDAIKGELPEMRALLAQNDMRAADYVHEESSDMAKQCMARGFAAGQDVLLDGTGDNSADSAEKKIKQARAAGYKVQAAYTTCSTDEAWRRNIVRAYGGEKARIMGYHVNDREMAQKPQGRLPPETMLREVHKGVSVVLGELLKRGAFDHVTLHDTEHTTDGKPTLVMSAQGKNLTIHHPELWAKFQAKAV